MRAADATDAPAFFESAEEFRRWLQAHATTRTELLVGFYKVSSGQASMSWSESVDEALCFGWIDGVRKRMDERAYSIRFTPRKPDSIWSAVNIAKYEQLQLQGRMTAAGAQTFARRSAARSKIYAYEQDATAELMAAEQHAFQQEAEAWDYWLGTPPSYQKVLLHWITTAKRAETRATRLAKLIDACSAGQRLR